MSSLLAGGAGDGAWNWGLDAWQFYAPYERPRKLPHLDGWNEARRRHAASYRELLDGAGVTLLEERPEARCVYHLFPVRTPDRDALAARLGDAGVHTGIHYSPSVPDQPPFAASGGSSAFPQAAAWAAEELSLPMFEQLETGEIERVAEVVARSTSPSPAATASDS